MPVGVWSLREVVPHSTEDLSGHDVKNTNVPPPAVVTAGSNPISHEPAQGWARGIDKNPALLRSSLPILCLQGGAWRRPLEPSWTADLSPAQKPPTHPHKGHIGTINSSQRQRFSDSEWGVGWEQGAGAALERGGLPCDPRQVHSAHGDGVPLPKRTDQVLYKG